MSVLECQPTRTAGEVLPAGEPLLFLRGKSGRGLVDHAGKTLRLHADGTLSKIDDYSAGALGAVVSATAHDATSFFAAIEWAAGQPGLFWVRGRLTPAGTEFAQQTGLVRRLKHEKGDKKLPGTHKHDPACLEEFDRRGHMIDVDSGVLEELRAAGVDIYRDPERAARLVATFLPDWVRRGPLMWSLSGSSGVKGPHDARFHFFFWTDLPINAPYLKALLQAHNDTRPDIRNKADKPALLDLSVLHAVQPHYLAAPLLYDEDAKLAADPLPKRWGRLDGDLPHSPLPVIDLFAGGSAQAQPARVPQRITKHTAVRTASGEATTLADLTKRSTLPKSSAGCERLIGDGAGLRGFHEPTRDAIFWRLVELLAAGLPHPMVEIEPYLAHLQRVIDGAPKNGRDPHAIASRRDIAELRRMAVEGLRRAEAVVARREARVAPLFPDTEVPLADAQADLAQFLESFFTDTGAYHDYHRGVNERAAWWREHRGDETRGFFNHLRINTSFVGAPIYIAAHETGLAKSSGAQRHIAQLDLTKWRAFWFAPNHKACEQARTDFAKLGVDAFVVKGINHEDDAGPICAADQQIKAFAERGNLAQASQRETACAICPLRNKCAYLSQAEQMRRPGVKILPHAFLQATIPGLSGEDAAPIFCAVLDENFSSALKAKFEASWAERDRGSTSVDKWTRDVLGRLADAPGQWATQDIALRKIAERAAVAADEYNAARTTARDDLRADIKAHGVDAQFGYASLARRQHAKFLAKFSQLVKDQLGLGRERLQGVHAEWRTGKDGQRRLHAEISYRALLPDLGCPLLALDATHDDRLTSSVFAERRYIDYGDGHYLGKPVAPIYEPKFRRVRAHKPFERIVAVPDAPSSKTALGTDKLKPTTYQRVPTKVRKAGAAIVARDDGQFDAYPPRHRRDSDTERVARVLRWWTEGASHDPGKQAFSAGIFGHKELRGYMEAHGMFGANVRPGHHGVGTALNDWQDVERFAVVGVTRLDDDQFAREVESFFALAPTAAVPRMTKRIGEAGIRLRDGSGYPANRVTWDDERVEALRCQIGEAQTEQELGRARSVWRNADNPVTILLLANVVLDRTVDAVVAWDQLERLTPFDVAASAGVVPTKAHELDKLLPGFFASPGAAQQEVLELRQSFANASQPGVNATIPGTRKNGCRGYIENLYIGAPAVFAGSVLTPVAGSLPADTQRPELAAYDVVLRRAKDNDRVQVLADPHKPEALARYAAALGKTLRSAQPVPGPQPILIPDAVPHCSPEHAGAASPAVEPERVRWQFVVTCVERLADLNPVPWPELPLAPALCAG